MTSLTTLSLAGLEKQLLGNLFANSGATGATDDDAERPGIPGLTALQRTQTTMVSYAFRDFVDYFLKLDGLAKAAAAKYAQTLPPDSGPLLSAPLHLDLKIEMYQQVDPAEVENTQPVSVHKLLNDSGAASRIEVCTPEVQADGSISYSITVIKLAVSTGEMQLGTDQTDAAAHGAVVGNAPVAATGGSVGGNLMDFLDQGDYQEPAAPIWDYRNDDAMSLIEEQKRQDDAVAEIKLRQLMAAAYHLLAYLQKQERDAAFDLTDEEKQLVEQATSGDPSDVTHQALLRFLRKKRVELEMARKEILEKWQATQDAHKIAQVQDQLQRLINAFEHLQQMLEKEHKIDTSVLEGLMKDFEQTNLGLGDRELSVAPPVGIGSAVAAGG